MYVYVCIYIYVHIYIYRYKYIYMYVYTNQVVRLTAGYESLGGRANIQGTGLPRS